MDQAFARPGLRHVECLNFSRDFARVIEDAGLVLLWNVNHCVWCSGCLIDVFGSKLAYGSMKLLYREYLMYVKEIGLKERRNGRGGREAGR